MAEKEGRSRKTEGPSLRDRPSTAEQLEHGGWERLCQKVAWIIANTGLAWDEVISLSPLRLKALSKSIDRMRTLDKLAIFDAQAAIIDKDALNLLNRELAKSQM